MSKRKSEKSWEIQMTWLDPKKIKKSMAVYARVARKELPPQQRPEFQLSPEERSRRIS